MGDDREQDWPKVRREATRQGWLVDDTKHGYALRAPDGRTTVILDRARGEGMFEVEIETFGASSVDDDELHALGRSLTDQGASGAATSVGGTAGGVGASFGIPEPNAREPFSAGVRNAVRMFERACRDAGIAHDGVARVVLMTSRMAELELSQPPETYLGVAEVAASLEVSRQRLAELRMRADFPDPVVELAAGPVWRGSTLQRFVDAWDRRPGRRPSARSEPA